MRPAARFAVRTTPCYERLSHRLFNSHSDFEAAERRAVEVLSTDPHNLSRRHQIKELQGVRSGEGQWRLRQGRWRFRHDIWSGRREVELSYCGLRRENTY